MNEIGIRKLRPCDVLLYRGTGVISHLILLLDGGSYSHSGVYDGGRVVEAIGSGVIGRSVKESVKGANYVDVYRFAKDGHRLGEVGWPDDPILDTVDGFVEQGGRYAYEQILLLALLAATRRIPLDPFSKRILRTVLDSAADLIAKLIAGGREPMIRSELVFRSFHEANAKGKYSLRIPGVSLAARARRLARMARRGKRRVVDKETREFERARAAFLKAFGAARREARPAPARAKARRIAGVVVPDFVTPRDLERSRDLRVVGRLGT